MILVLFNNESSSVFKDWYFNLKKSILWVFINFLIVLDKWFSVRLFDGRPTLCQQEGILRFSMISDLM